MEHTGSSTERGGCRNPHYGCGTTPPYNVPFALKDEGVFPINRRWYALAAAARWINKRKNLRKLPLLTTQCLLEQSTGLYRLDAGIWNKLPVETSRAVCSLTVSGNNLYIGTAPDLLVTLTPTEVYQVHRERRNRWNHWNNGSYPVKIFHSADLGASWTEIIAGSEYSHERSPSGI